MIAYMVQDGCYEDTETLAVFVDQADAEAFTNHRARTTAYRNVDDLPRVVEIDLYRPGAWRPDETIVVDGELVMNELTR